MDQNTINNIALKNRSDMADMANVLTALPKYFITSQDSKLVSDIMWTDPTKWTVIGGTVAADTTNYLNGCKQAIRIAGADGTTTINAELHNLLSIKVIDVNTLEMDVYSNGAGGTNGITMCDMNIKLMSTTHAVTYQYNCYAYQFLKGRNRIRFRRTDAGTSGSPTLDSVFQCVQVMIVPKNASIPDFTLESPVKNIDREFQLVITVDDGKINNYTNIFSILKEADYRHIKHTFYVSEDYVKGTSGTFMNSGHLGELEVDGNHIGNHTKTHPINLQEMTYEQVYDEIMLNGDYLERNGFKDSRLHVCYPNGHHSDIVGQVMTDIKAKTGVTIDYDLHYLTKDTDFYKMRRAPVSYQSPDTLTDTLAKIDKAMKMKATIILMLHNIVQNPSVLGDYSITDYRGLLDGLNQRNIVPKTMSQLYNYAEPVRLIGA
jgi:peptidoglycan/xylan/chitin deacetylase (PgdA/CDA1 family)